jgi:hypothetical protein
MYNFKVFMSVRLTFAFALKKTECLETGGKNKVYTRKKVI